MSFKKRYLFLIFILGVVFLSFTKLRHERKVEIRSCSSSLRILGPEHTIDLYMRITILNNRVFMGLSASESSKEYNYLILRKYFSYIEKDDGIIIFTNENAILNMNKNSNPNLMRNYIPSFFMSSDKSKKLTLKIKKISDNEWVFMGADTPYFICKSN